MRRWQRLNVVDYSDVDVDDGDDVDAADVADYDGCWMVAIRSTFAVTVLYFRNPTQTKD